jgi:hypothetical protein
MKGILLLFGTVLFFVGCGENTTEFEGGIPPGLRAILNGRYWEADSTIAYKMSAKSSATSTFINMMVIKGFRKNNNSNYPDMICLTLHDDRTGTYSTLNKNFFANIEISDTQGIRYQFYTTPDAGEGEAEIFSMKNGVIDGHFNCITIATESPDSLYVEAGSFKMAWEDHTSSY